MADSGGVYQILCAETEMRYIGSSQNVETRMRDHERALESGEHRIDQMQSDYDTHGAEICVVDVTQDYIYTEYYIQKMYHDRGYWSRLYNTRREWISGEYRKPHKGENNHFSKLSAEDVIEIRERYADEDITMSTLGDEYNSSSGNISDIINKKIWSHI